MSLKPRVVIVVEVAMTGIEKDLYLEMEEAFKYNNTSGLPEHKCISDTTQGTSLRTKASVTALYENIRRGNNTAMPTSRAC